MTGRTIAHYQILEKLGEGGMGVVYKARDTHLDRFVALKLLPPEKVADPERKRRFIQEAKAASALNHPNIVVIHDIASDAGCDFIVMELVAGRTLDQLIGRRGLHLNETFKYSIQMADALAKAHAAGIVHRDLKPGNVMVTGEGLVKVLDFGLAKLTEPAGLAPDAATETMRVGTEEGTIIGTAGYMSPEQAQARPVDARSDIFSFGSMLYEMATGRQAFRGDSKMSTLAAIINQEPAPLPAEIPHDLSKIISRCLRKDPARRFHHMEDLKVALEDLKEESESGKLSAPDHVSRRPRRRAVWAAWVLAAVLVLFAGYLLFRHWRGTEEDTPLVTAMLTAEPAWEGHPSFSPDGTSLAYTRMAEDYLTSDVYVKLIGEEKPLRVTETKDFAGFPEWSPDGRSIAFTRSQIFGRTGRVSLWLVPPIGGTERKVGELDGPGALGHPISWMPDGASLVIVDREKPQEPYALFLLVLQTGQKRRLTSPPAGTVGDTCVTASPNGRSLVFSRWTRGEAGDLYRLELSAGATPLGDPKRLTSDVPWANWPAWTPDGRSIVFCSKVFNRSTLWRVPADGSRKPVPLPFVGQGSYNPAIARKGQRLAYIKHTWDPNIWRVELTAPGLAAGAPAAFIQSTVADSHPQYAPNGQRISFVSLQSGDYELWISGPDGSNARKLTSSGVRQAYARWSPDSERLAFVSEADGNPEIYVIGAEGGPARRLTSHPGTDENPRWSADGQWIHFRSDRSGELGIWKIPAGGGEAVRSEKARFGEETPDGRCSFYFRPETPRFYSLWQAPAGGGEGVKLVDSLVRTDFAVSPRGIYFIGGEGPSVAWFLKFRDSATGRTTTIAPVRKGAAGGVTVSPDGKCILYTQADRETADIALVENFR